MLGQLFTGSSQASSTHKAQTCVGKRWGSTRSVSLAWAVPEPWMLGPVGTEPEDSSEVGLVMERARDVQGNWGWGRRFFLRKLLSR